MLLIRHGQSEFNVVYSVTRQDPGIRDPRLTEEGKRQAEAVARRLENEAVSRLVASPYMRALETAEIIAQALDLPIAVDAGVGERAAFACDVGTPAADLRRRWPGLALDHLDEIWWPTLEESETALGERCERFRRATAGAADWTGLAVITHWGFIRGLTGLSVPNSSVLRFDPSRPDIAAQPLTTLPNPTPPPA